MFGGQPGSSAYLAEARRMLDVYRPLLIDYVARMSAFLDGESKDPRFEPVYAEGLDVLRWLTHADSEPDAEYLITAPVSMPLTGLVQLMRVMVLFKTLGVQGIATATAFSMLSDEQSFVETSTTILGLLLLIGVVPQVEHPKYRVIEQDSGASSANSTPRPMVYVRGLSKCALEAVLAEFNDSQ
ncbi:hypothetical protein IWW55_001743, partial [Coemansia sp. RSA 2706]